MSKKVQAASGAIFAVFVAIHLFNTALAAFGLTAYDTFQEAVRGIYQAFVVEVVLLSALTVYAQLQSRQANTQTIQCMIKACYTQQEIVGKEIVGREINRKREPLKARVYPIKPRRTPHSHDMAADEQKQKNT